MTLTTQQINNIYHTKNQHELVTYLHQFLFLPTKSTLLKAIRNDQLLGISGLTENSVNQHLQHSTVTIKGHIHREPKNNRSTTTKK